MKKKMFICGAVLALCTFNLPAFAGDPLTPWMALQEAVMGGMSFPVNSNIIADPGGTTIANTNSNSAIAIESQGIYIQGPANSIIFTNDNQLDIAGPGSIISNGAAAAIANFGYSTLILSNNLTINGGISQVSPGAVIQIGGRVGSPLTDIGVVTVTGASNNITSGAINYVGTGGTFNVGGGVLSSAVTVDISSGNALEVSGGNVTLNGSGSQIDTWAGEVNLSGMNAKLPTQGTGTLTLDAITHNTTNGEFIEQDAGSSLILQNGSKLTLTSNSKIQDGSVSIANGNGSTTDSTLEICNGLTTNSAAVTMGTTGTLTIANSSASIPTSLTLLTGTSIQGGNININAGNTLNIAGGNVAFYSNEPSIWLGTVNNIGGNLELASFNAIGDTPINGQYTQASGSLLLTNESILNLNSGSNINGGKVSFDKGGSSGNVLNVSGGTVAAAAVIDFEAQNTINISGDTDGGSVTFNSGDTWLGKIVNTGAGTLTLDGFAHDTTNGKYTQSDSANNASLILANGSDFKLSSGSAVTTGSLSFLGTGSTLELAGGNFGVYLNLDSDNTLLVSAGSATLDNNMINWTNGGHVSLTGGTITMEGLLHDTSNGSYNQTGGELDLTQKTSPITVSSNLILSTADSSITGGIVKIGGVGGAEDTGNSLTIAGSGTLGSNAAVTIATGNTLNISGGTATLDSGDTWLGDVNVNGTGDLNLSAITTNGKYTQTGAGTSLTLYNNSILTLGADSAINSGEVVLAGGEQNTLNIAGGTLAEAAVVYLPSGTINITDGNATLDGHVGTADSWAGVVKLSGTGNLTLDAFNANGSSSNGKYLQTGGALTLENGAKLTVGASSSITGGNVNFTPSSSSQITINGGSLAEAAVVDLEAGNTLAITNGTATLDGNLGTADTVAGNVSLAGGTLNIDHLAAGASSNYTQTGGTANITNGSSLLAGAINDTTSSSTVNIGTTPSDTGNSLTLTNGLTNSTGYGTTINVGSSASTGNNLNVAGGTLDKTATVVLNAGNNFNVSGGTATLDTTNVLGQSHDVWAGDISVTGGNLILDNVTKTANTTNGTYTQSNGTLTLYHDSAESSYGTNLTLGAGSSITGGTVQFNGTSNTLEIATSATFGSDAILNLSSGSVFKISGGDAALSANDNWAGQVNLTGGTLAIAGVTSNGSYYQTGGSATVDATSTLSFTDNSSSNSSGLDGGTLANSGTLNFSETGTATIATQLSGAGTINKNASGETIFTADNSGFTGTYNQTAGKTTINNNFFTGVNNLNGGNVSINTVGNLALNTGDSWTTTNVTNSNGTFTLDGFTHDATVNGTGKGNYSQSAGTLNLNNASTLITAGSISGGTVAFGSTGSTLGIATGGTLASAATVNLTAGNTLSVSGGTATLDTNSGTADTWAGAVNVSSGTLTLDHIFHDTVNGAYSQTGGVLNITNGTSLTLGTGGSITGGTVNVNSILNIDPNGVFGSDAILNLSAGHNFNLSGGTATLNGTGVGADNWAGTVTMSGGNLTINGVTSNGGFEQTAGTTTIGGASTITLVTDKSIFGSSNVGFSGTGNNLNIAGGSLGSGAALNLTAGNNLNMTSGFITLNSNDIWNGAVNVTGGILTLDGATTNGIYTQNGGKLAIGADSGTASTLTLGTGSSITAGTIWYTGAGSSLNVGANSTFASGAALTLNTNNSFNVTGGTATLNANDVWAGPGAVNVSGGSLTLDGVTTTGVYTQTGGTLNIGSSSGAHSLLTLGADDSVTGGTVAFGGTGNTLKVVNGGNFDSGASLNISSENNFIVAGGTATLNGKGAGADVWSGLGTVFVGGGVLNLNGMTSNGIFNLSAGTVNLSSDSVLTYREDSNIGGGNLVNSGTIYLAQTTQNDSNVFATNLTGNGVVNKNGIGKLIFQSNCADFTGTYNQSAGNVVIYTAEPGTFFEKAIKNLTGGNLEVSTGTALTLKSTDKWTNTNISNGGLFTLDGALHDTNNAGKYNQTGGGLLLANGSTLKLGTGSSISGGSIGFAAKDNALEVSTGSTVNSTAVLNLSTDNYLNIKGGNASIDGSGTGADTWAGTVNVSSGTLALNSVTSHGAFNQSGGITRLDSGTTMSLINTGNLTGGVLINDGTLNITNAAAKTVATSLMGNGVTNKDGAGTLLLTGHNLGYTGDLYIKEGLVDFNFASGRTDSYISGKTFLAGGDLNLAYDRNALYASRINLSDNSTLTLDTNGHSVVSLSNAFISSLAGHGNTLVKEGNGSYSVLATNADFNYGLNVKEGSVNVVSKTANFNDAVTVGQGPGKPIAVLRVNSSDVNFNKGLDLSNAYMSILKNGFDVTSGGLSVGSTVNTMNGVVATNNIIGNLNIGTSGTSHYLIDISPSEGTSDKYKINGDITTTNSNGVINISDFKIVGAPKIVQSVNLHVFDQTGTIDPIDPITHLQKGITFTATDKTITSALGQYGLTSNGAGNYTLGWKDFNPQAFRGQVATEAAYANQLTTNGILFDHINLVSQQFLSDEKANVYANENPLFAPYQYSKKDGTLWYKAYGNIERLQLSQGINTQNNLWGSLIGADFPLVELKNGWKLLPTAYVGYTGGYQTYNGVNMYQNGGQGGVMGTFYKGNFIESLLANVGGYGNDMNVAGAKDSTGNWFAGVSSKSAYNIKLPKDFILQPSMLLSYNAFGGQNWGSSFGGTSMTTNMMNGLNLAPGVNLILNKETWSVYATTQLMFNLMNGVNGTVGDVNLPTIKMGSTYFQYGVGVTKRFKDRLSMYGQIVMSNGVRTGVGFQGGLQWKF